MRLFLVAIVAAALQAAAPAALPTDLARSLEQYNRATVQNDVATLSTLMADDYLLVNSDASVQDKASCLADFRAPGFKIDPYVVEQPVYKVHGNTALTAWAMRLGWTQSGQRQSRRLRIAHYWVKRGGRWQIEFTQLTRMPD